MNHGIVTNYSGEATGSRSIYRFAQGRGGAVWAASPGGLMRFDGSRWQAIGAEWNVPAGTVYEVAVDPEGTLWISASGALLRLDASRNRFVVVQRGLERQRFARNADGIFLRRSTRNTSAQEGGPHETASRPMLIDCSTR